VDLALGVPDIVVEQPQFVAAVPVRCYGRLAAGTLALDLSCLASCGAVPPGWRRGQTRRFRAGLFGNQGGMARQPRI
jgi:hypothetical protein